MKFQETGLDGAYIVSLEKKKDERGFFARGWCAKEFSAQGLSTRLVQANISFNERKGTLRGMHYQSAPRCEAKLVRCTRGAIYDVIVDLRPASKTYEKWIGTELGANNHSMLYVPEGFAHGFVTLENDSEVLYFVTEFYSPEFERGVRFDDPHFRINWPVRIEVISQKDKSWPDFFS